MILPLTPDWRIHSDNHCWILQKRAILKTGKRAGSETWINQTYHPSVSAAVNRAAEMNLRLCDAQSFTEALAEVERYTTAVSRSLKPSYVVTET